jgi:subfamily B ATP-binding cassette protein MsbA
MEKWRKILNRVIKDISKEKSVIGIILYGPYAQGMPSEKGILYLLVVVDGDWWKKDSFEIEGVPVDVQYQPLVYCREKISKDKFFGMIRIFLFGQMVYAKGEAIKDLVRLAKEVYLEGPAKLTQEEINTIRLAATRSFDEIKQAMDKSPDSAALLMTTGFQPLLDNFFKLRRFWAGSQGFMLSELRKRDPKFYTYCLEFLGTRALKKKFLILIKMFDYVLKPVGGFVETTKTNIKFGSRRPFNILLHPFALVKAALQKFGFGDTPEGGGMANIIRFLAFLKPYKFYFLEVTLFSFFSTLLLLPYPFLTQILIDDVFSFQDLALLRFILVGILVLTVFRSLINFVQGYYQVYLEQLMQYDIRFKFFRHLLKLSQSFYDEMETGQILYRFQDAMASLKLTSEIIIKFLTYAITLLIIPVVIFLVDWRLALLSFLILPFTLYSYYKLGRLVHEYTHRVTAKQAEYSAKNYESISGMKLIQALSLESYILHKLRRIYLQMRKNLVRINIIIIGVRMANLSAFALGTFIILWFAWHRILTGNLSFGTLIAFLMLGGFLLQPIRGLITLAPQIQRDAVRTFRFFRVYDLSPAFAETPGAIQVSKLKGEIEFKNVSFEYELGKEILRDINLKIQAGTTVAIVGKSGEGKTTLANLIPRFYEATNGEITVDGTDIRRIDPRSLRHRIGIVPQVDFLFEGEIKENIKLGKRTAGDEEIIAAAQKANVHDFIMGLPNRYETRLTAEGAQLSEGERKRLSIARALVRDPDILILDEATSSLDPESEEKISKALNAASHERTTLVIAHRLSTIKEADLVIMLEGGRLVAQGQHQDLMKNNQKYRELFERTTNL